MQPKNVTSCCIREGYLMTEKVSQSHTGQNEPKPSRQERDAAFSSGAGRKAAEDDVHKQPKSAPTNEAPIGTDLETKADDT
jgi:hypothetical protein